MKINFKKIVSFFQRWAYIIFGLVVIWNIFFFKLTSVITIFVLAVISIAYELSRISTEKYINEELKRAKRHIEYIKKINGFKEKFVDSMIKGAFRAGFTMDKEDMSEEEVENAWKRYEETDVDEETDKKAEE